MPAGQCLLWYPLAKAKLLGLTIAGLASATLGLVASPAQALTQFDGYYAPANWTQTIQGDGSIDTSGAPASRWQVVITPAWRRACSNHSAKPAASEPADLRSCGAIPQSRQPAIAEQQLKQRTRINAATAAYEPLRRLAASGALRS